jgi:hypothetical protein
MADLDLKMRPRFAVDVPCEVETLVEALRASVADADPGLEGHFDPAHCVLRIPSARRSFWSPELDLTFESREPAEAPAGGLRVRALFAPRPPVWTGFAFVYAVLAVVALAGALYGLAQLTLGEPPRALGASAAALALIGGVYAATFIGRGLAATQMYELRRALDDAVERAEARARATPRTPLDSARL